MTKSYTASRVDFKMTGSPTFEAESRLPRCNIVLPKPGLSIPGIMKGTKVSCTFRGGQCTACRLPSSTHRINDSPVILMLTDEFGPCMVGSDNDCMPTIRIEGGSIEQMKAVISWQLTQGLKFMPGSICLLGLTTHLCRTGHEFYWAETRAFSDWCRQRNLLVMPLIMPFPSTISKLHKTEIHKTFTHTQLLHYGNAVAGKELRFCLWEPLSKTAAELPATYVDAIPATFRVPELGDPSLGSVAVCSAKFITGFSNYDDTITSKTERMFLVNLVEKLRKIVPMIVVSENLPVIPSNRSIGLAIQRDINDATEHDGKTVFLVGNSILGSLEKELTRMAEPAGVEIISLCKAGSYKKVFLNDNISLENEWSAIKAGENGDILVFSVVGNEMLHKKAFYSNGGKCHISHPKLLSDQQASDLVKDITTMLAYIRGNFAGKVIILGPTPRHLVECCTQAKHKILDVEGEKADMIKYTDAVTDFISKALTLEGNVEFVGYREQLGGGGDFVPDMLTDGVHLHDDTKVTLSGFIMSLLDREPTLSVPAMANLPSFQSVVEGFGVRVLNDSDMEDGI